MYHPVIDISGHGGIMAAMIAFTSSIVSFAAHGLPVVQFVAACVAIVAGVVSIYVSIKRHQGDK